MRERRADGCKEGSEESPRKEGRKEGTCQEGRKEGRKEEEVTAVKSKGPRHLIRGPFPFGLETWFEVLYEVVAFR